MALLRVNTIRCAKSIFSVFAEKTSSVAKPNRTVNLFHYFKKGLRDADEIEAIVKRLPDDQRFIGELPHNWRSLFSPKELSQKTREVQQIFSQCADSFEKEGFLSIMKLGDNLSKVLSKKCSVSFVDSGSYGSVIRIRGANEDLALKVFHKVSQPPHISYQDHGQIKEIANAVAINHALKPSQHSRFYCAKLAPLEKTDGFMLSSFEDAKPTPLCFNVLEDFDYKKFVFEDVIAYGNILGHKIVDFGKIFYKFDTPEKAKFAKKLYPLIKKADIPKILELKQKHKGNPVFEALVSESRKELEMLADLPGMLVKKEDNQKLLENIAKLVKSLTD